MYLFIYLLNRYLTRKSLDNQKSFSGQDSKWEQRGSGCSYRLFFIPNLGAAVKVVTEKDESPSIVHFTSVNVILFYSACSVSLFFCDTAKDHTCSPVPWSAAIFSSIPSPFFSFPPVRLILWPNDSEHLDLVIAPRCCVCLHLASPNSW